jgi:HPt (histidine-containing phosphotransfer) domain-containing protein
MDLLSLYYKDGVKQAQVWQSVPETGMKDYHIWVHALKSASANIGALALSEQARAQEMAAKDGDYAQVQSGFPRLMETYRTLLDEIGSQLRERGALSKQDQVTEPALEAGELKQRLRQALERLEDFQPEDCTKAIGALLRHPLPEAVRARLHEALDKMRMYQDDDAEDILRGTIDEVDRN